MDGDSALRAQWIATLEALSDRFDELHREDPQRRSQLEIDSHGGQRGETTASGGIVPEARWDGLARLPVDTLVNARLLHGPIEEPEKRPAFLAFVARETGSMLVRFQLGIVHGPLPGDDAQAAPPDMTLERLEAFKQRLTEPHTYYAPYAGFLANAALALKLAAGKIRAQCEQAAADLIPEKQLVSWREITDALGLNHDEQDKVKSLNERCAGPIPQVVRGGQPIVKRNELIRWWNKLDIRHQELQNQRDGARLSAESQHDYGKTRTSRVVPEIGGSVKVRRADRKR